MDESFPAKRFKSNKMINRATSGSEATLHICEQFVGFKIPDKSTIDQHLQWQIGADECCIDAGIDPSLPSPASIFEPFQEKEVHRSPARWESGRDQRSRRSREKEMDCKGLNLWK